MNASTTPFAEATLDVEPELPAITSAQSLNGWRRELCVELRGEGVARVFVRTVEHCSFKAPELQRAILFHRLDLRFADLPGCVASIRPDLQYLAATARRHQPERSNLFVTLDYDRSAWERVQQGIDRWVRR
jgi:hypothetical protein